MGKRRRRSRRPHFHTSTRIIPDLRSTLSTRFVTLATLADAPPTRRRVRGASRCVRSSGAATVSHVNNPYSRLRSDAPTECRDLHELYTDDGWRIVPLDHWGLGCPFGRDVEDAVTDELHVLTREQLALVAGERKHSDEMGEL